MNSLHLLGYGLPVLRVGGARRALHTQGLCAGQRLHDGTQRGTRRLQGPGQGRDVLQKLGVGARFHPQGHDGSGRGGVVGNGIQLLPGRDLL